MSERPSPPAGEAPHPSGFAEGDTAGRLGEQVGRFAMLAMRRIEQAASAGVAAAERTMARQTTAATGAGTQTAGAPVGADRREAGAPGPTDADAPAPASTTARAEAIVDGAGAQLGVLGTLVSHQLRRAAALAREEVEDMWAEAQQIRAAQRRTPD